MSEIAVAAGRELWEKMPGESLKAFNAFALYRDLGVERTIEKVCDALGTKSSHVGEWSSKHHWVERAEAYEMHLDRRRREQRESERDQAERAERVMALTLERVAMERIRGRGRPGEDDYVAPINPGELAPADALRFYTEGVRNRRLADGQATDFIKGAFAMTAVEAERLVRSVIEVALPLIPEELHERFILGVQAIGAR